MTWKLVSTGAAAMTGLAMRRGLSAGWRGVRREDPPRDPSASDVSWPSALAWGVAVGAVAGVARVIGRRGAATGWERATGGKPPRERRRRILPFR
ncbi:MAG: DUF4235 domain-containing protein [Gemmatimonadota bacterium]